MSLRLHKLQKKATVAPAKKKGPIDRFDGMQIEDLEKCKLPDILAHGLDMIFVGINPGLNSAYRGRYYAGPGNHFYKLLHAAELTPRLVSYTEDDTLPEYGIGLTNIVERPTRTSADLHRSEIKEGAAKIVEKLSIFQPKIAIFNGKGIYQVFANQTNDASFRFGLQPKRVGDTALWVVPSSSARCTNFPRMTDKLHFYTALKKYLSHLKGELPVVEYSEFQFDGKCKPSEATTSKMWRRKGLSAFKNGGRVANRQTLLNSSSNNVRSVDGDLERENPDEETSNIQELSVPDRVEGSIFSREQLVDDVNPTVSSCSPPNDKDESTIGSRDADVSTTTTRSDADSLTYNCPSGDTRRGVEQIGAGSSDEVVSGSQLDDDSEAWSSSCPDTVKEDDSVIDRDDCESANDDSRQGVVGVNEASKQSNEIIINRSTLSRRSKGVKNGEETDFISLIKQRLAKKESNILSDISPTDTNGDLLEVVPKASSKVGKKLKFDRLKKQ